MQVRTDPYYQALGILARRDHSVFEIRQKLKRKNFAPDEIADTIEKLKTKKLLNDEKFATLFCEYQLRTKPVGPRYLQAKLKQKGIGESVIAATLASAFPAGREAELARQAAASWRRSHPRYAHDRQRLARFLASRGFSSESISTSAVGSLA